MRRAVQTDAACRADRCDVPCEAMRRAVLPTVARHSRTASPWCLLVALALMLSAGVTTAWAQTWPDGVYYLKNNVNNSNPWYLWPSVVTNSTSGNRYLTTYQGTEAEAVTGVYDYHDNTWCHWVVKNVTVGESHYIQLINPKLDKYIVIRNKAFGDRDVWLEDDVPTDDATRSYFQLTNQAGSYYRISPTRAYAGNETNYGSRSFNSAGNDKNGLGSGDNGTALTDQRAGLIQLFNGDPKWTIESHLLPAPTISDVGEYTNTFTITDANSLPAGYTIRYTTAGSTPTATSGTEYTGPVSVTGNWTVKAVVVRYGVVLTEVATKSVVPVLYMPVISFDNTTNKVSITCATAGATIYYNTGDGSQAAPTSSSSTYSTPFDVASPTTVKAISTKDSDKSEVATLTIGKVATPTIQNNDSNAISITSTTSGATIYYTTDGSTPTTGSTQYTAPLTENVSNVTIKAIAVKDGMINSEVGEGTVMLQCATPVITRDGMTFTITCNLPNDATIYYSLDGNTPTTEYTETVSFTSEQLPMTVKAVAKHAGYTDSETASFLLKNGSGTAADPYLIYGATDFANFISKVNAGTTSSACYKLEVNVSAGSASAINTTFSGTFDGGYHTISGLTHPLFNSVNGGTVKNIFLDNVSISGGTNVGAICNEATGNTRIYNCGILATNSTVTTDDSGYTHITSCSSTISGTNYVGGIVGLLDGSARVINCFSYANITGGTNVGGIVGYNNVATTSNNLKTMVMNCMFYGDITGGTNKAPIYNGTIITNVGDTGVGNYNYFWGDASYVQNQKINTYNCALMAETRFLQRFEFFRHLLNSHRELAAWWATGDYTNKDEMAKWVLLPSQIGSSTPYPVLAKPGYYPSVVNIDAENATAQAERNKGGLLGTLSVTIQMGSGGAQFAAPTGAEIVYPSLTLNITDKDFEHFNFNYAKVQLPYYNDVGTKNYTSNRVVTGWKITNIETDGTITSYNSYSTGEDATTDAGNITAAPYNFADRNCTAKDLYSSSGRVFNQGAYWDVPEGVTAITIEPYWAKAAYVADGYADVVYDTDMKTKYDVPYVGGGELYTNGGDYAINGETQKVYTSIANAIGNGEAQIKADKTVNDYAIVLVGNYHEYNTTSNAAIHDSYPYTVTTIDLDGDNEPDYSLMFRNDGRNKLHPVKYDFLNFIGLGMAQKSTGGKGTYDFGIMRPIGWFETTNTSLFRVTQFEYDAGGRSAAPLILQGGVMEQWVNCQNNNPSLKNNITYFHVGGNVWFKEFHRGTHIDDSYVSKHPPVSVTGGDYDEFYLTGLYKAVTKTNDDAECYINGGRFGIVAGTGMEGIGDDKNNANTKGNIIWQIQNADIDEFYGGGINAASRVGGSITTVITGSHVGQFCGGPKFGDMYSGKTVMTTATDCVFDTFFGAGYGGNSYSTYPPPNNTMTGDYGETSWNTFVNDNYKQEYASNTNYKGVSTNYYYQYLPNSNNYQNVARLFVNFVIFSLATTHSVTSTLTGCTINENFYGGGSLGKVDGPVTSTLTNCTVKGNVFGAGYSASLPKVEVMNTGGFVKAPYYDANLGVYMEPTYPATVTYKWQQAVGAVNSTETAIDKTNHILYTTENLSHTNLGSVSGKATLTLDGTTVSGSVYGGGDESMVNDSDVPANAQTEVTIKGGSHITGNVFGGGNNGNVSGSTTVNIQE